MQGASNDTKAKILEAATEYFLKTGYKAATTRDIAKAAGVNLGLIPYYFSTKVNLARQVSIDLMEHLNQKYFPSLLSMPAPERMYVPPSLSGICWNRTRTSPGSTMNLWNPPMPWTRRTMHPLSATAGTPSGTIT